MRSNTNNYKSLNYYIVVVNKNNLKIPIKFLGLNSNNHYYLYDSYNNSRVLKFDNEDHANNWLIYNFHNYKNLIDHNNQTYIVMSIERIKKYDENRNKKYITEFSGQC